MNLLIIGAGGHGHVCKEIAEMMCDRTGEKIFHRISFLDDESNEAIGTIDSLNRLQNEYQSVFVALGNSEMRRKILDQLERMKYQIVSLIHPSAIISKSAEIGIGSVIMQGAIIQTNAKLGKGTIVSAGALIDHDAVIEDCCHINSGAVVASMSKVPSGTKIDYLDVWKRVEL